MRFHISFNWKTIKNVLIPLGLALAIFLGFNTMTVYASDLPISSANFYIQGTREDNGSDVITTFTNSESVENNFVLWGPSGHSVEMIRNGLFLNYTSKGTTNYLMKVRYLIKNWNPYIYLGKWGCSSWADDIYDTSCTISGTGSYADGDGNSINYIDVTYSYSTYGSTYVEFWLSYSSGTILVPNETYFAYDIQLFEGKVDGSTIIIDQNETIINQNKQQIEEQKETNEKLDELKDQEKETYDYLTDDTPPESDISSLGNVQGLLPPGPVDSLLNIPFQFLSVINSSFGGVCVPYTGDFVFDSTLTLPCFSEMFYDEVPPLLLNFLSLIPASFILMQYFKHLYKKVNRAVSMETTADDEWGVL